MKSRLDAATGVATAAILCAVNAPRRPTAALKNCLVPALVLLGLLLRPHSAFGDSVLYEAHTPATSNYISFCDGTYHGLRYCDFTDTFSIASSRLATAITWYDLGCNSADEASMVLLYDLVNADTYALVAETTQSAQVTCTPDYPAGHNNPTTLAIDPATLVAGQRYFVLLRASNNEHARAYWGTDAGHNDSFQVQSPLDLGPPAQMKSDATTTIAEGGTTMENTVVFKATLESPESNSLQLQIETQPFVRQFTGQANAASAFITSGDSATVAVANLADGEYHWRARVVDLQGNASMWQEFGTPGNVDFTMRRVPLVAHADTLLYEQNVPPTGLYPSGCAMTFGYGYCEFSDFTLNSDAAVDAMTWWPYCDEYRGWGTSQHITYIIIRASDGAFVTDGDAILNCRNSGGSPQYTDATMTTIPLSRATLQGGVTYRAILGLYPGTSPNGRPDMLWGVQGNRDSFQLWNSIGLTGLAQLKSDGATPIAMGAMTTESTVVFHGVPSNGTGDQVRLQIELRRLTEGFTGQPTASSSFVAPGELASVAVFGLIDGAYHWKARVADSRGYVSDWQEFGPSGSSEFEVFAGPLPTTFPIPNPSCRGLVTFVPYAPMLLKAANFWTCCHDTPNSYIGCYGSAYSLIFDASGSIALAQSDSIPSFAYTTGCGSDLNYTTNFSGANQIILQPGVAYTFKNVETDGSDCSPGPYHPDSAYLIVAPVAVPGEPALTVVPVRGTNLRSDRNPVPATYITTVPKGSSIEVLPLCTSNVTTDCNDPVELYTQYNGYYWLRVKLNGSPTYNGSPVYIAENTVVTVTPTNQEQAIRDVLTVEQPQRFVPDSLFPSELIIAMAKWESSGTLNNELTSVDSPFGGLLQVHPGKSGVNRNCYQDKCTAGSDSLGQYWTNLAAATSFTDIFGTSIGARGNKVYMQKLYTHTLYSNDATGIANNLDDGLAVLQTKYNASSKADAHGDLSQQEVHNISTVYQYNQGLNYIKEKAIFRALDPSLSANSISDLLLSDYQDPATKGWITNNITPLWIQDVRNACAGKSQSDFGACLDITGVTRGSDGYYLSTSAKYLSNVADQLPASYHDLADKMRTVNTSSEIMWLNSPGELSIVDGQGNVTGIVDGAVVNGAANTAYDSDSGIATIFFPDSTYYITVKGTATGTYGLVVHNLAEGRTVNLRDIPTSTSTTHAYTIDWAALAQGQNGVTLTVDNGDGIVRTTQVGQIFSDSAPPQTIASVSGSLGFNGWYISNVLVSLNAADNPGGVGVKETRYSLDGGAWQLYAPSAPISITANGLHTIQYYSTDLFGNQEATATLAVKISKAPVTANVWVGLKNSDDVGIRFDLLVEVYQNANLVASGTLASIPGGSSGFNNAHLYSIPLSILTPATISAGDTLALKLYVRNACNGSGKNSGTARLWYGDGAANSNSLITTINPVVYFLGGASELLMAAGSQRQYVDIAAGAKCSSYKAFGTWNVTL